MSDTNDGWHLCPERSCTYWGDSSAVQRHFAVVHGATNNWVSEHNSLEPADDLIRDGDGRCRKLIFRAWKIDSAGNKIWARDHGLRAWRIYVPSTR
jgi:hypothetical protein